MSEQVTWPSDRPVLPVSGGMDSFEVVLLSSSPDPPGPSRDELLLAARILAGMVEDEWPGTLTESTSTWGRARTDEEIAAIGKLEAYLDAARDRP